MGIQNCHKKSVPISLTTIYCHVPGHHVAKSVITDLFCSYNKKSDKTTANPTVVVLVTGNCFLLLARLKTVAAS